MTRISTFILAVVMVSGGVSSASEFSQDIASIQRLGSRSQPLGAGGRTAPAAIVDRQLQNLQQRMNLPPRYRMGRIWIDGGHEVAKGIQRRAHPGRVLAFMPALGHLGNGG